MYMNRPAYLIEHLLAMKAAIDYGVKVIIYICMYIYIIIFIICLTLFLFLSPLPSLFYSPLLGYRLLALDYIRQLGMERYINICIYIYKYILNTHLCIDGYCPKFGLVKVDR
jgi:hypothetical protein